MENEQLQQLVQRADELYAKGQFGEARQAYEDTLEADPGHAWAHSRIGALRAQDGDLTGAEAALKKALELDPKLAQAHSNLGNVHFARGQYEQALAKYKEAIGINPDNPVFHQNLHAVYKKLGRVSEAVAALKQSHRLGRAQARDEAQTAYKKMKRRIGCLGSGTLLILLVLLAAAVVH
ncbi:MAG TPA: tetratricopeptide repeat protein [Symbiobacteriaceae bacterium]|jgi:tetratricopeptide (TPR) repeat protein